MLNYLTHNRIDKNLWDDCISRSINRRVYGFSWYLDIVCPGWEALVTDGYSCVFPLTGKRKWGISYLAQPYFAQQLGVFSPDHIPDDRLCEFIRAIPRKFRLTEISLNSMNGHTACEGTWTQRTDYELNLAPAYAALAGKYSQNTRRNLRKAGEHAITVNTAERVDELIGLFRDNYGRKEGKLKEEHYAIIRRLMLYCIRQDRGVILTSEKQGEELSAAAFFLSDQSRVYFLFAASAPGARENGAMFLLIDRFIADHASSEMILDFEGGNDPNLGRFYNSFGAEEVRYPALRISRIPKMAEWGFNYIRKCRK